MPLGAEWSNKENASDRIGHGVQDGVKIRLRNREIAGLLRQVNFWTELSLHLRRLE